MPIVVSKAKENLDISIGLRSKLFLNNFYIDRVYYNAIRGNNRAWELNVLSVKAVFNSLVYRH